MTTCFAPQKIIRPGVLIIACLFAFSCSFGVGDNAWTKTFSVSQKTDIGSATGSIDANQNVIAIWQQTASEEREDPANINLTEVDAFSTFYQFGRNSLLYSFYRAESKVWTAPVTLHNGTWVETHTIKKINDNDGNSANDLISSSENSGALPAIDPQVRMDSNGDAIAVWQQIDLATENSATTCNNESTQIQCGPVITSIWTARFTTSTATWSAPTVLDLSTEIAKNVTLELDSANNAIAVWRQWDVASSIYTLYASHYMATDNTWASPTRVSDAIIDVESFKLSIDGLNNAFITWQSIDHGFAGFSLDRIYAIRYTGGAWESIPTVISNDSGNATNPSISSDSGGNAWLIWQQTDSEDRTSTESIWASRFNIDAMSWGTPGLIESSELQTQNPDIHAANTSIIATWEQEDVKDLDRNNITEVSNIYISVYDTNTNTWGIASLLEDDNVYDANQPRIYTQANNSVMITWRQYQNPVTNSGFALLSKNYSARTGLSGLTTITSGGQIINSSLYIYQDKAIALWEEQANKSGTVQVKLKR